jgi:hypothetical protein
MAPQCPTCKPFVFSSYGNRVSKSAQFGRLVGWVISLSAWCPGAIRRGMPLPIGSLRADEHGPASGPGERWKRVGEKSCEGFASTGPARPNPGYPPCTEDEAMPDRIYGGSGLSYGFKLNTVPFPPILRSAWGHRRAQGEHRAIVRSSTGASAAVAHPVAAGEAVDRPQRRRWRLGYGIGRESSSAIISVPPSVSARRRVVICTPDQNLTPATSLSGLIL